MTDELIRITTALAVVAVVSQRPVARDLNIDRRKVKQVIDQARV